MRSWILLICLILFAPISKAGLSLEPYFGYGIGYFATQKATTYTGLTMGSRFGYSRWNLMLGTDVSYTKYTPFTSFEHLTSFGSKVHTTAPKGINQLELFSQNQTSIQSSALSYNVINFGPSIVFGLPLIIDAYASALWSRASNQQNTMQGAGVKVGASYLNLPFLSVNLELQAIHYFACIINETGKNCPKNTSPTGTMYMATVYVSSPINTGIL